jgi:S1-C subfamily serine protease
MKKSFLAAVSIVCFCAPVGAQAPSPRLRITAVLVDSDLNQKPVPHLDVVVSSEPGAPAFVREVRTDFSGSAKLEVPPGKYRLVTPLGIDFQGRHFSWEVEVAVTAESVGVDLSNDNAHPTVLDRLAAAPAVAPKLTPMAGDLELMFQRYQKSVVTVWSEIGSGTGFIVDSGGLILTNQHVIGPSELVSVQFDAKRKVAAKVLAMDPDRDVAALCADLSAFPGALVAAIAHPAAGQNLAMEGERVFTIGSPLGMKKIITSGIVSKVEDRALISDVNINPGNSGGPLFSSAGEVLGITTFGVHGGAGAGVAGIVRIEQTEPLLERARRKMNLIPLPSAKLLPVEPLEPYPLDALKKMVRTGGPDTRLYTFAIGDFDVTLETPVLIYKLREKPSLEAVKERGKRNRIRDSTLDTFDPLLDRHGWEEYAGEYRPVLTIEAEAQLREKFTSLLGRELIPTIKPHEKTKRLNFRADFFRMRLLCGAQEIEPIQRFRPPRVENDRDDGAIVTDASFTGSYVYGPEAISPSCGKVTLELYSEKDPKKAASRDLDRKTIDRVWEDFQPYVQMSRRERPDE